MRLSHVEARIEQQLALAELIAGAYDCLISVGLNNVNFQRIRTRLAAMREDWERFSIVHEAIMNAIKEMLPEDRLVARSQLYFTNNMFASTRELYLENVERFNLLIDADRGTSFDSSSVRLDANAHFGKPCYHQTRLPRIELPKFNGTSADWLPFKDLFNSLVIANPSLSSVEKLQYLKTCLISPADHLLKNMAVTEGNFQRSWDALIAFYENKRVLVNAALHSLLSLKRMTKESAVEMERLYTSILQIYRSLENLQRPVDSWDDFLVFIATQRLDSESVKAWEHHLGATKEPPTWSQFTEFLISRLRSLQAFEKSRAGKSLQVQPTTAKTHYQGRSSRNDSNKENGCPICSGKHYTSSCPQYSTKTVQQRKLVITKYKLCFNCLGSHRIAECKSTRRCLKCGLRHHTTLHTAASSTISIKEVGKASDKPATIKQPTDEPRTAISAVTSIAPSHRVLLATARIRVTSSNGHTTIIRALIDQGSEISVISERIVQRLNMKRNRSSLSLIGIGAKASNRTKGVVNITLSPHFESDFKCGVDAYVLVKLTSLVPSMHAGLNWWPHLEGLQLADPDFAQPGSIDLILGADVYGTILLEGLIKGSSKAPIAQHTSFGWMISGSTGLPMDHESALSAHVGMEEDASLILQRFWELDEIPSSKDSSFTPEEQACENHFQSTHSRDPQGRYVVRLPFKESTKRLGDSRKRATCLIHKLKQRLESNPTYSKMYSDFIKEYALLQHMELVPDTSMEPSHTFYLPHHGVLRETSLTTKLRVVFNGSSKSTSGYSLNDLLYVGPKLQTDLFNVLIWFRQFRYVFSSDIEKMFRQIKVHHEDWRYQHILWINDSNHLETYQLTTVTYGMACAPFLALRAISQLIIDEGNQFPLAVPTLTQGRYVDDLFGGADTVEEAQVIVQQIHQLCTAGGFHLQKWTSNSSEILSFIPEKDQISRSSVPIEENLIVHSLGLAWHPGTDSFQFNFQNTSTQIPTKRIVLSTIAKLFDPLGLLSPITILAKILMQEIWTLRLQWDEPLPTKVANKWRSFVNNLQDLTKLRFPRWLGLISHQRFEIHGYADASPGAYAAAVYSRSINSNGTVHTQLICSKTKVAPLKRMTIPRLELAGAVLVTKLVKHLLQILNQDSITILLWTDSTVVYTWITNHPSRWKDFVHNRKQKNSLNIQTDTDLLNKNYECLFMD
ncbi:PREDICTED: uncharacterized protein LOC108759682 [Trachymyrmex cornetzi]|uniref:uncharacterized protein LOC108759682 n=1 Tax=Trachymyrmex cornetzi TaxID=471704 RepID=UPI00084EE2EE|nr:PREDICTED: uncharacterized protein LOC108759682 [Trachymyrmex cornetzi]